MASNKNKVKNDLNYLYVNRLGIPVREHALERKSCRESFFCATSDGKGDLCDLTACFPDLNADGGNAKNKVTKTNLLGELNSEEVTKFSESLAEYKPRKIPINVSRSELTKNNTCAGHKGLHIISDDIAVEGDADEESKCLGGSGNLELIELDGWGTECVSKNRNLECNRQLVAKVIELHDRLPSISETADKYGWRALITRDPFGLKNIPQRLPYYQEIPCQKIEKREFKPIRSVKDSAFFQNTLPPKKYSYTIHPNFSSEPYEGKKHLRRKWVLR